MHRPTRLTAFVVFAALALFASACGGDSDSSATTDATTEAPAGSNTTAPNDTDPNGSGDPGEDTPSTADGPIDTTELTASFRGVTAEAIKIGIVIIDVAVVGRSNGDVEAQWNSAIDAVNNNGGVAGRMLEPVFVKYSPLGDVESEAACVELTGNAEVFAAMGPLLSNITCFTDINETIFINTFGVSQEEFDRSTAVAIGPGALPARSASINVNALVDAGELDGAVAVHASADSEAERDIWIEALEEAGVNVVTETQSTVGGGDIAASDAEMQTFAQVWESESATAVLGVGAGSGLNVVAGVDRGNFRPKLVLTNPSDFDPELYRNLGYSTDALVGSTALGFRDFQDLALTGDAGVGDCIDRYESESGETVNVDPQGDEAVNLNTTVWACQAIDIFAQIASAAGADLTNDSFRSAAENLGPMTVTAVEDASIGAGKFDIGDGDPLLLAYDPEADDFVGR